MRRLRGKIGNAGGGGDPFRADCGGPARQSGVQRSPRGVARLSRGDRRLELRTPDTCRQEPPHEIRAPEHRDREQATQAVARSRAHRCQRRGVATPPAPPIRPSAGVSAREPGKRAVLLGVRVSNPASQWSYRVVIRGPGPGGNFCSCPDYATGELGTCKHLEFTLGEIEKKRVPEQRSRAATSPLFPSSIAQ